MPHLHRFPTAWKSNNRRLGISGGRGWQPAYGSFLPWKAMREAAGRGAASRADDRKLGPSSPTEQI